METSTLNADDGRSIPLCHWPASDTARGVVLISHGLGEYAARYDRFALQLASAGFEVYAHDHRGHGKAADLRGYFADGDGWQKVTGDVDTMVDHLLTAHPHVPLVLYGHSMGSFIARSYLLQHGQKLDGMVLSATGYRQKYLAYVLRALTRWTGDRRQPMTPNAVITKLVFGSFNLGFLPTRTAFDWLSRDTAEVDRYAADPLCGFVPSSGLWQDLFGGIITMEDGEKSGQGLPRDCPVLLLAGSRDPVSLGTFGLGQLARRYRGAGIAQVEVKVYPGGRHEMHHETNRDVFMSDLLQWLNHVADKAPQ